MNTFIGMCSSHEYHACLLQDNNYFFFSIVLSVDHVVQQKTMNPNRDVPFFLEPIQNFILISTKARHVEKMFHHNNHYELSIHEPPYALQVLVNWQMLWALEQKWSYQDFMLLTCVSWKSSIAFSCWPALTSSVINLSNAPHWNSKIPKVKICTFLCQSMYCYELNISSWSSSILTSYTW